MILDKFLSYLSHIPERMQTRFERQLALVVVFILLIVLIVVWLIRVGMCWRFQRGASASQLVVHEEVRLEEHQHECGLGFVDRFHGHTIRLGFEE